MKTMNVIVWFTQFLFHPILMKLGKIVLHMEKYNFTKFHQNQIKNKKIMKIIHSALVHDLYQNEKKILNMNVLLTKPASPLSPSMILFYLVQEKWPIIFKKKSWSRIYLFKFSHHKTSLPLCSKIEIIFKN